ncbi:phage holin family protein (plasmid) [Microbulbifer sp. ANSA001]|uniref:phage holin family protein n=1 Tax=Microbulbifer sp. ANSA001 TaxID=3243358 RepID=UPI00404364D9
MPDKDPGQWLFLLSAREQWVPAVLGFVLSYVRIIYDEEEPKPVRQLLEAGIGGILVFVVGLACEEFGLSSGWSYFGAGVVGVLGVNQVRSLATRWASHKVSGGK